MSVLEARGRSSGVDWFECPRGRAVSPTCRRLEVECSVWTLSRIRSEARSRVGWYVGGGPFLGRVIGHSRGSSSRVDQLVSGVFPRGNGVQLDSFETRGISGRALSGAVFHGVDMLEVGMLEVVLEERPRGSTKG